MSAPVDPANPGSPNHVVVPGPAVPQTAAAAVMLLKQRVTSITKDGHNPQGNFAFRGIDQVMNTCGPLERDLGLLVLPELRSEQSEQVEYGAKRTLGFRTRVTVAYRWLHASSGTELAVGPFPGEAMDSGDKGTAKAMSVALRTMYLQVLTVPTGEPDPDQTSYEVAQPEADFTDPVVENALREKIEKADALPALRDCYKAVGREFAGDRAKITAATRDELMGIIKAKVKRANAQAAVAPSQEQQASAATNAAGAVHPDAPARDEVQ